MALFTYASLPNSLFSLPFPGLDLRGLGGGSCVKVRFQPMYLNA